MAPLKGQKGYPAFLKKQTAKRQKEARETRVAAARKLLKRELLALRRDVDMEVNERATVEHKLSRALTSLERERERCRDRLQQNKLLKDQLAKARVDLANATLQKGKTERKLSAWSVWWQRVQENATAGQMSLLFYLGRARPRATDRGWGGGQ